MTGGRGPDLSAYPQTEDHPTGETGPGEAETAYRLTCEVLARTEPFLQLAIESRPVDRCDAHLGENKQQQDTGTRKKKRKKSQLAQSIADCETGQCSRSKLEGKGCQLGWQRFHRLGGTGFEPVCHEL